MSSFIGSLRNRSGRFFQRFNARYALPFSNHSHILFSHPPRIYASLYFRVSFPFHSKFSQKKNNIFPLLSISAFAIGLSFFKTTEIKNLSITPSEDKTTIKRLIFEEIQEIAISLSIESPKKNDIKSLQDCEQNCFDQILKSFQKNNGPSIKKEYLDRLTDKKNRSLLMAAVELENDCVQNLYDQNISRERTDSEGNTPLHIAARYGKEQSVRILYKWYSIKENNNKEIALHVAIQKGRDNLIETLQCHSNEKIKCIHDRYEMDAFELAVSLGKRKCFDALIKGVSVELGEYGMTHTIHGIGNLLHIALKFKQDKMLKHLLSSPHYEKTKQLLYQEDDSQRTPLEYAVVKKNYFAIEFLIDDRPSLGRNSTCLPEKLVHWAIINKDDKAIDLLEDLGVPLTYKSNSEISNSLLENEQFRNYLNNAISSQKIAATTVNFSKNNPRYLVFKGGGPKGYAYFGALKALEKKSALSKVRKMAGTSAGAITAALLAVGYTRGELFGIMENLDFEVFFDPKEENKKHFERVLEEAKKQDKSFSFRRLVLLLLKISATEYPKKWLSDATNLEIFRSLFNQTGFCKGKKFREWLDKLIATKIANLKGEKDIEKYKYFTFGELRKEIEMQEEHTLKHLHVYASKLEGEKLTSECIHSNLGDGSWDKIIISDAVRASMSIPVIFKTHQLHSLEIINGERIRDKLKNAPKYCDGGLTNNFPIEAFDNYEEHTPGPKTKNAIDIKKTNTRTLGLGLEVQDEDKDWKMNGIFDVFKAVSYIYFNSETLTKEEDECNKHRIIQIPIKGVSLLDFKLIDGQKDAMLKAGEDKVNNAPCFSDKASSHIEKTSKKKTNMSDWGIDPNFKGRKEILDKLKKKKTNYSSWETKVQFNLLYGLPGMGKSQIALNFAKKNQVLFSQFWFIDCKNDKSVFISYRSIAEQLGLIDDKEKEEPLGSINNEEKKDPKELLLQDLKERVHSYLEQHLTTLPWLLILDNVDKKIMPGKDFPTKGGYIIATTTEKTNCQGLGDAADEHHISQLDPSDSIKLLGKILPEENEKKNYKDMENLAEDLYHFPLALNLAAQYIKTSKMTIARYLKENDLKHNPLDARMVKLSHLYENTLQNVWNITLKKLKTKNPAAVEFLEFCAFLSPDFIESSWTRKWLETNTKDKPKLGEVFKELRDKYFKRENQINKKSQEKLNHERIASESINIRDILIDLSIITTNVDKSMRFNYRGNDNDVSFFSIHGLLHKTIRKSISNPENIYKKALNLLMKEIKRDFRTVTKYSRHLSQMIDCEYFEKMDTTLQLEVLTGCFNITFDKSERLKLSEK